MPESGSVPIKNTAQGVGQHLSTLFFASLSLIFQTFFVSYRHFSHA